MDYISAVKKNAARIRDYKLGHDGSDGLCDCVGLIIGALRLMGRKYSGIHGSNYFARNYTNGLHQVTKGSQLKLGQVVYKAHSPGESGYNLPSRYASSPDKKDYYHIGIVISTSPLKIAHCSSGGMHYDTKLGRWSYAGDVKGVTAMSELVPGTVVVDVPNDGTVNVRAAPKGNAKIIKRISEGTAVNLISNDGEWSEVSFTMTGFIKSEFLREVSV